MHASPEPPARAPAAERLVQVDGLRAIAALSVVAFHYTTRFDELYMHTAPTGLHLSHDAGLMGVQLFFAISGFVIFMTVDRVKRPMDFVAWRFSRLFPAYWAAVAITFVVLSLVHLPGHEVSLRQGLVNLTMLQFFFSVPDVDGVYWSLQVELVFYAWMLFLWATGLLRHAMAVCVAWVGLALAAALAERAGWGQAPFVPGYFLLIRWIPWFAIGMAAYVSLRDGRFGREHAFVVGLSLAAIAAGVVEGAGWENAAVATLAAVGVFLASRGRLPPLAWRPLVYVGAISYPLYMVHGNIGFVAIGWLERQGLAPWPAMAATLALALVLASLLHHVVEMPGTRALRRLYRERTRDKPVLPFSRPAWSLACVAALVACAVALMVTARLERGRERPPTALMNPAPASASPAACRPAAADAAPKLVIVLGQSNAASHAESNGPAERVRVFTTAGCAEVTDPLPRTTGKLASIWSAIPALVREARGEEIVIAPLAAQNTRIQDWLDPDAGLRPQLEALLAASRASGMPVVALLWQQGEADAQRGTEARHFRDGLLELRRVIDKSGIAAPLVVARSTWCLGRENGGLRRAIAAAAAEGNGLVVGPDTDRLGPEYRVGCHSQRRGACGRRAALGRPAFRDAVRRRVKGGELTQLEPRLPS
jgi:peptidoglycan/LPS O-acetylase OafA/YrhL